MVGRRLFFERSDLLAERRLADSDLRGRPGEVQFLGDCKKISNMAQFHFSVLKAIDRASDIYWTVSQGEATKLCMSDFVKKIFLITGVSSGFGHAFAEAALTAGHTVVGTVRNKDALQQFERLNLAELKASFST